MNFKSPAQNQVGQFWHGRRRKQFDVRREFGREKCQIWSVESPLLHKNTAFRHESTNLRQCIEIRSRDVGSIKTIESVYRVRACRYSRLMSSVFVFFNYFRKMIRLPMRSKENVRGNDFYPVKVRLSLYSRPVTWWLSRLLSPGIVRLYHFVDPIFECFTRDGDRVKLSHRWEVAVSFMITRTWYQISICLRLANTNDVRTRKWKGEVAWESRLWVYESLLHPKKHTACFVQFFVGQGILTSPLSETSKRRFTYKYNAHNALHMLYITLFLQNLLYLCKKWEFSYVSFCACASIAAQK